jgi:hypothetical protein
VGGRVDGLQLFEQAEPVFLDPDLRDLAVPDPVRRRPGPLHGLGGRLDVVVLVAVRAGRAVPDCDGVAFGDGRLGAALVVREHLEVRPQEVDGLVGTVERLVDAVLDGVGREVVGQCRPRSLNARR